MLGAFVDYDLLLALLGAVGIAVAVLPRVLADKPLSYPIVLVAAGAVLGLLSMQNMSFQPADHPHVTERLTELGVILALMGSGLKLDRALGWKRWGSTWRLLGITMPLTIVATALLGWWAGLPLAAAVLAGAVLAPTDPVLASDVQVPRPGHQGASGENETRFALTSEAGLNDGLAFPFTYFALSLLAAGGLGAWIGEWVLVDVLYRIGVGVVAGFVMGRLLALVTFEMPGGLAKSTQGFVAIAMTLITYGVTQMLHAYGFVAVFVAAIAFRSWEKRHRYHRVLHDAAAQAERSVMAVLMVLFGASVATGLLADLDLRLAAAAAAVILLVRPLSGLAAFAGSRLAWPERWTISFFGIRGIGSFYYLSFALNRGDFPGKDMLWAFVAAVVLISVMAHGLTARPAMQELHDRDNGAALIHEKGHG